MTYPMPTMSAVSQVSQVSHVSQVQQVTVNETMQPPARPASLLLAYVIDLAVIAASGAIAWWVRPSVVLAAIVAVEAIIILSVMRAASGRTPGNLVARTAAVTYGTEVAPGLARQGIRTLLLVLLHLTVIGPAIMIAASKWGRDKIDTIAGTASIDMRTGILGQGADIDVAAWEAMYPAYTPNAYPPEPVYQPYPVEDVTYSPEPYVTTTSSQTFPVAEPTYVEQPVYEAVYEDSGYYGVEPGYQVAGEAVLHQEAAYEVAVPGTVAYEDAAHGVVAAGVAAAVYPENEEWIDESAVPELVVPGPAMPEPEPVVPGVVVNEAVVPAQVVTEPALGDVTTWVLLDSGDHEPIPVGSVLVLGRAPLAQEERERAVPVADPGKTLSRTHVRVGCDPAGVWVVDEFSTNGTAVRLPDGERHELDGGEQRYVPDGTIVEIGDRRLTIIDRADRASQ